MRRITQFTSLALGLVACPVLMAQTTAGSLAGTVLTKAGGPIAGVKVIISSKALFTPKTVTTDEKGEWREYLLPPGEYDIVAAKNGFVSSSARNVRVGIGGTMHQDLFLAPVQVTGATVEVLASAASVDKSDTKTATNYSAENLETLATIGGDRGFLGALSMAPGVVSETPSGGAAIRGGTLSATNYSVNGADVKDQIMGQVTQVWYVQDNIEDVQVVLSPLNARYGRAAGGSVNVVTKTGSNDFGGSLRVNFDRQSWNANSALFPANYSNSMQRTYNLVLSGPIIKDHLWYNIASILSPQSSAVATLAGGSWRDPRGVYPSGNKNIDTAVGTDIVTGVPLPGSTVPAGYVFGFPQQGAAVTQDTTSNYVEGKITGAITPDHILEYTIMRAKNSTTNDDPNGDMWHDVRVQSLGTRTDERKIDGLTYRGTLASNLFIEAHYTANEDKLTKPQGDTAYAGGKEAVFMHGLNAVDGDTTSGLPYYLKEAAQGNQAYGYQPFGPWVSPTPTRQQSRTYNLDVKWIKDTATGTHEIDFGIDGYGTKYDTNANFNTTDLGSNNRQYVIGGYYQSATDPENLLFPVMAYTPLGTNNRQPETAFNKWSMGLAPTMIQYSGPTGGTINTNMQAIFANDQWTINQHWNAMLGARFESQNIQDSTGATLIKSTSFSPRVQIRYDVKGDSRSLITFTAAEFQGDLPQAFAAAFATYPQSKGTYYGFSQINGVALPAPGTANDFVTVNGQQVQAYGTRIVPWSVVENPANYGIVIDSFDNTKSNIVDSGLKPPTVDEVTLGYSRSWQNGSNFSITYVNRNWKNLWAIGNSYDASQVVTISAPTTQSPNGSYGIQQHFFNSSALQRAYNALEMSFDIKTKSIWSVAGSWTYSRLTGNDEQGDDPIGDSTIMQTNPTPMFNNAAFLNSKGVSQNVYAPYGRLVNDLTNRIRLGVTATIPLEKGGQITFNWTAHYSDGQPFGSYSFGNAAAQNLGGWGLNNLTAGPNNTVVGSGAGSQTMIAYAGGRRPFEQNGLAGVDFRAAFKVPLRVWKMQLIGDLFISNFFNHIDTMYNNSFNTTMSGPTAAPQIALPSNFGLNGANANPINYTAPRTVGASLGVKF